MKLVSRASYELSARSPFDAPLSSRFDENDAVVVFDDVLIPWEDVLVYRDVKRATAFYAQSGFTSTCCASPASEGSPPSSGSSCMPAWPTTTWKAGHEVHGSADQRHRLRPCGPRPAI